MIESEPVIAIVDKPYDTLETSQPFGKRWGGQLIALGQEHLVALQQGKLVAVDVQGEYVVFLQMEKEAHNV
jgi:hypothetical protein